MREEQSQGPPPVPGLHRRYIDNKVINGIHKTKPTSNWENPDSNLKIFASNRSPCRIHKLPQFRSRFPSFLCTLRPETASPIRDTCSSRPGSPSGLPSRCTNAPAPLEQQTPPVFLLRPTPFRFISTAELVLMLPECNASSYGR